MRVLELASNERQIMERDSQRGKGRGARIVSGRRGTGELEGKVNDCAVLK